MSIKYTPTPSDPEELRREDEAKDHVWQSEAEEASKADPEFARWKKRHTSTYAFLTGLSGILAAWFAWPLFDVSQTNLRALVFPFGVAASVWGFGRWKFNNRCREIALEHWDRMREERRKAKDA